MPAKSAKQFKFMEMIAHGGKSKNDTGPSEEVAREMISKTPNKKRRLFMKGKKAEKD